MPGPPSGIRTEGLTKTFGRTAALADLDLEVARGEVFGYLGPNGAGKTTTIRILLDLLRPTAGRAEVLGFDTRRDVREVHRRVAYVAGDVQLWPNLTGAETLHLLGRVHGSVDEAYRDELVDRFDLDGTRRIRQLSKGNRQKVVLIAALMTRAEVLILDEPTAGLDPLMEQVFRACVAEARDRGQSVFLSSHLLSEVEAVCDRVGILRAGRLIETGSLTELRHLAAVSVEVTFTGSPPDIAGVPGVHAVVVDGSRLRCQVRGPMEPLVDALAGTGLTGLLSRESSLEDLFLARYGDQASDASAGS